ncbi:MAG: TIGR00159 family protein [Ruminococcaceae bacterium]|nr:TIGR00159 family protein [Oscillospiraceae bacterium]
MNNILLKKGSANMGEFFDSIGNMFVQVFYALKDIRIADIIDILLIAYVLYKGIDLFKKSRAGQLMKGILILLAVSALAQWLDLVSVKWVLNKFINSVIIIIAIIFQPELRRALERVGRGQLIGGGHTFDDGRDKTLRCIDAVCKSCASMQEEKIGALIVFERSTLLGEIVDTGTLIDADASPQLVSNIFFPKSPLHDGAMIIRDGRVLSAGCILPLTANDRLHSSLGTRHRAALGMSENSDAAVVVVSEETGIISIAVNGEITRNYNSITLREELMKLLFIDDKPAVSGIKGIFKKVKSLNKKSK